MPNQVVLSAQPMQLALMILLGIFAVTAIATIALTVIAVKSRRVPAIILVMIYLVTILTLACGFYCHNVYQAAVLEAEAPSNDFVPTQE